MAYFPVTNSNLSATHLAAFLQEKYFPDQEVACRVLKTGISDTYLITAAEDKYIFRVYSFKWRSPKDISEELRLLRHLQANDIAVSFPIQDQFGEDIQYFEAPEGRRPGVLFSYAPGSKAFNFSTEAHAHIGALMARMHLVTLDQMIDRVTYTEQELLVDSLEQLKRFLSDDTDEMKFMKSAQSVLLKEYQNANVQQIRKGVVHMDIWFDNLNITEDDQVTLFDFDFCGNGWLCLDLAYYILQVHSTEKDETERTIKIKSFIDGYESITKLSDEEKRLIPMLGVCMYFFYLGIQSQRFDNWSNVFVNDVYLSRFINLLVKKYYDLHHLGK